MSRSRPWSMLLGALIIATGCASPTRGPSGPDAAGPSQSAQPSRTLVVATRAEPPSLARRPLRSLGLTADLSPRIFNADLTIRNDAGLPVPYLAEAVPQLNTDSWKVNPDGTMQTTYRLKPNTVWHDGQPITADDWVFSFEVYSRPEFGLSSSLPMNRMSGVTAPDPRTVVFNWKQTYPDADGGGGQTVPLLTPLPRHILGSRLQSQDPEAFAASSFWTQEYVGAGPYKLEKWEPGSFLEAVAFDGDVLGKPKISRIRELFIGDPNTALANILAGESQMTSGDSIRFTDGETLRNQWGDRGTVLNFPNLFRIVQFQRRPEFASTRAFTDLRVRQALSHGWDFSAVNEVIQGGRTVQATGPIPPTASYYGDLQKAVPMFTYDPRRVDQLMTEAGFSKGADGVWVHPNPQFGRMSFETNVLANPDSENEMHLMADNWRKLGFDIKETVWAAAIGADAEQRNSFPGLSTTSTPPGEQDLPNYRTDRIPTEQRRWQGNNRGAWIATPEYDHLVDVFETSLDRLERIRAIIGMNKIYAEDAAVINLYWKLNAQAVAKGLTGPRLTDPNGSAEWNIQEWELK
jgi:peptide/nickel transport system substrate-binding protein